MNLKIVNPTSILIEEVTPELREHLTYDDKSVRYQIHRMKTNVRYRGSDWAKDKIAELQSQIKKTLIWRDKEEYNYTYSGLHQWISGRFRCKIEDLVERPEPQPIPFKNPPEFDLRDYQKEAVERLIAARHGAVEHPTGAGKSLSIIQLCFELGLKAVIVAPLSSIAEQLYDEFVYRFGQQYVCFFGGTKKKTDKLFTIAIAQSLAKIEPGDKLFDYFQENVKVLIFDESHVTAATTFEKICMGPMANAPYRFFFSATQMRTDGSELLLKGITGPIVSKRTYPELVEQGYLAPAKIKIFNVNGTTFTSSDPKKEVQNQLYNNPYVNRLAANIANKAVNLANRPTIILIEEFSQFAHLKNHITVPFEFVHGGVTAKGKDCVPKEYWKCDKKEAIRKFNDGEVKLLIGTTAISTGVDTRPTGCIIYLQGGKAEIKVRQGIGRGTRIHPGKKDFWVIDFNINSSPMMQRHLASRAEIYSEMGPIEYHG